MRKFDSFDLVYSERFKNRGEAMRREAEIKKWPKDKKEKMLMQTACDN